IGVLSRFRLYGLIENEPIRTYNIIWELPTGDLMKVNFDVAYNQITKKTIVGIAVRNKESLLMAAGTHPGCIDGKGCDSRQNSNPVVGTRTMYKDMEDFLFKMLGEEFRLEMDAIQIL
ncbi:hypothetical protein Golax_023562, partial [Gossypium laxum]|nr:hypothetical protein [Gossypium laxum]